MSITRRGLFGLLGAVAAGAFVEPAKVARVFLLPPLEPASGLSALDQLNVATRNYVRRNSAMLVDNVFHEFPAIALFRGTGKTRAALAVNRFQTQNRFGGR